MLLKTVPDENSLKTTKAFVNYLEVSFVINKKEFLELLADKTGFTQKEGDKFLKAYHEIIVEALEKEDGVRFLGFGTYATNFRKARTSINPQTGKKIKIAAHYSPVFKYGEPVKKAVINIDKKSLKKKTTKG